MESFNFFQNIPKESKDEIFETLLKNDKIKVERIISYGQVSDENFWYDQEEDEFVIVLKGNAFIEYYDGTIHKLTKGDSLYIKAHQKHKVIYTENPTLWLAVFI